MWNKQQKYEEFKILAKKVCNDASNCTDEEVHNAYRMLMRLPQEDYDKVDRGVISVLYMTYSGRQRKNK